MTKLQKRSHMKMENIQEAALELFAAHGVDKVSMDEIAAKANVSKVTIYKYFGSKEDLYAQVVNRFIDETLIETEKVFDSNMDFPDKLKFVLLSKANSSQLASVPYLLQIWEQDRQLAMTMNERLQTKVKALMYKLFEEGKQKGFIEKNLSFDILYLYSEIFRAGLKAKSIDLESALVDKDALEKLVNLYFFGLLKMP